MAEHQNAQAATSKSPNRALWLAALDELEQDFLAFQKDVAGLLLRPTRVSHLPAAPRSQAGLKIGRASVYRVAAPRVDAR